MIRLSGVSKLYPPGSPVLVDVNLAVEHGEFVFLNGAIGAGKTTLLKMLFGREHPSAGVVVALGRNLERLAPRALAAHRRELGIVSQEFKLLPELTALENVALPAQVAGRSALESRRRAAALLDELELAAKRNARPAALSAGERQKIAVARALVNDPALILADEPTENLDADSAGAAMRLIGRAHERGATVLVATHEPATTGVFGRRVVLLEHGRIVGDEPESRGDTF